MLVVDRVLVEKMQEATCKGPYLRYHLVFKDLGTEEVNVIDGMTCPCRGGCHGTDHLPEVSQRFVSTSALLKFLEASR